MPKSLELKVCTIIKKWADKPVTLSDSLKDLGLDSLDRVAIGMDLETEFDNLIIKDAFLTNATTVQDIVDMIRKLRGNI